MISYFVCAFIHVQRLKQPGGCPGLRTNQGLQQSLAEKGNSSVAMTLILTHIQLGKGGGTNLNHPQRTVSL